MRKPSLSQMGERSTIWSTDDGYIIYVVDVTKKQIDYNPNLEGKRTRKSSLHKYSPQGVASVRRRWNFVGYL